MLYQRGVVYYMTARKFDWLLFDIFISPWFTSVWPNTVTVERGPGVNIVFKSSAY